MQADFVDALWWFSCFSHARCFRSLSVYLSTPAELFRCHLRTFFLVPRLEIIIYMKRNNVAVESWRKRVLTRRGLCLRTCRAWDLSSMVDVMEQEISLMQRMKQIILRPFSLSFVSNFTGCEKNSVCENEINRRRTEIAMKMESWWRKIHDEVKLAID